MWHGVHLLNHLTYEAQPVSAALILQGILDIDGGMKKAVHVRATADIADLSIYKLQVYSNANTSPGASHITIRKCFRR